jgi:hypothetical protein
MTGWELLGQCLGAARVRQVFGAPIAGIRRVPVAAADLAALLADADGRLGPGPGAALLDAQVLRVSSKPGGVPKRRHVTAMGDLPDAVAWAASVAGGDLPGSAELALDLDLDGPAAGQPARPPRSGWSGMILGSRLGRVLVFAGPGVVRAGAAENLRGLAEAVGLGVSNSWGAKGVFEWKSPHHLGTVGLQERDYELGGFHDADTIVATGIDPDESPRDRWAHGRVVTVPPAVLIGLVTQWAGHVDESAMERPPLFDLIAGVVQPQWQDERVPMAPARVLADLAEWMAPGDRLVADPGPVGLWTARAFATTELWSVVVPATVAPGFAVAAAVAGAIRHPRVRVTALTAEPLHEMSARAMDLGRSLGVDLVVELWGAESELASAPDHSVVLRQAWARRGVQLVAVPVDFSWTDALVEVAGPVVAWTS